ncbi:MAG: sugar phosphate nucleotidyltransferase [Candidatus Omnitrophota bacterium]|jgi:bifunctional UDP-N-acetylglucosamine pyrophosphorylase/glucosamine-1-phosphate N-acetyltransferase
MKNVVAIILAAGRGTRMKSDTPKVLHNLLGTPIIFYVIDALNNAGVKDIITVAGYGSPLLKRAIGRRTKFVIQKKLLGSGDAVIRAKAVLGSGFSGNVLVICGDTPLVKYETIKDLINKHNNSGASATILTAKLKDPTGYGRILRDDGKSVSKIVEEIEAGLYEEVIDEINVGTYCFKAKDLYEALAVVKPDNRKKEIFLTDVIEILHNKGRRIESVLTEDESSAIGINDRSGLAEASAVLKKRILDSLMLSGVTVEDPATTTIYPGVEIGRDTVIRPNTVIESGVTIGQRCLIGPFARLRGGVKLDTEVEVGNFVELVRTTIGARARVKHHTYLGDAIVGRDVNIGAGTITANFDGVKKNRTIIEDGAFIGVGARLIAPVKVGRRATVGAGCVVPKNKNVPGGATVVGIPARIIRKQRV